MAHTSLVSGHVKPFPYQLLSAYPELRPLLVALGHLSSFPVLRKWKQEVQKLKASYGVDLRSAWAT